MTAKRHRFTLRRLTPRTLAVLSAGTLAALMAGPASAGTTAQKVINASLNDVACTSPANCMAVGWFLGQIPVTSGFQNFPLAERWNGSTWMVLPVPAPKHPGGGELLNAVSCASSTSCIAVGQTQVFSEPGGFIVLHPFAESWNGSTWSIVTPALANNSASLNGVSCVSPSDCMAVGSEGTPRNPTLFTLAEHWNGTAWQVVTTPPPLTPGGTSLATVSCLSTASCMAVGYYGASNGLGTSVTLAEQWNGTTWRQRTTPTPGRSGLLGGVACTAPTACLALGSHESAAHFTVTLAEQWNGTGWKVLPSPNPRGFGVAGLGRLSCPAAAACMGVGAWTDPTGESSFNLAEAWNGSSWGIVRTPSPGSTTNELRGVSCTSPSACMAVGDFTGIGNEMTLAESWNGTRWSVVPMPRP